MAGSNVGYTCHQCGFRTDTSNCDRCDGIVKWGGNGRAYCTGCDQEIVVTTCRKCGNRFSF